MCVCVCVCACVCGVCGVCVCVCSYACHIKTLAAACIQDVLYADNLAMVAETRRE